MAPRSSSAGSTPSTTSARPRPEQRLCHQLISLLQQGVSPWRRPWAPARCGPHRNLLTGRPYQGGNPALLELQLCLRGSDLSLWIGYTQAASQGWHPRKGSHGCPILRPVLLPPAEPLSPQDNQPLAQAPAQSPRKAEPASPAPAPSNAEEAPSTSTGRGAWSFRTALLFHASDLVDAPAAHRPADHIPIAEAIAAALALAPPQPLPQRLHHAEAVLRRWPVPAQLDPSRAFYVPQSDQIHLPPRSCFHSPEAFLATWAHEAIHSTGHPRRLNREGIRQVGPHGSPTYAREELIAELGAFLLTQRLSIGSEASHHAAYLQHWIQLLQDGPQLLHRLLGEACRAADLVCPETPAAHHAPQPPAAPAAAAAGPAPRAAA